MPIDTRDWHRERYGYRLPGRKFPWAKIFLLLLVIACVVLVGCFQKGSSQTAETQPSPRPSTPIATIAELDSIGLSVHTLFGYPYNLCVWLKPTTSAVVDRTYVVELYEKGHLKDTTTVSWNQPELNVLKAKAVEFPITEAEFDAYFGEDISHVFSVRVSECQEPKLPDECPPTMDPRQFEKFREAQGQ